MSPAAPLATEPPQALDAEEYLLGAVLTVRSDSPVLDEIHETGLRSPDFYRPSNGLLYTTALELHAEGIEPDAIALRARLEHKHLLDKAGGPDRVRELALLSATLPNANAAHWARLIVDTARRRNLGDVALQIRNMAAENGKPPGELWESARALLEATTSIEQTVHVRLVTLEEFTAVTEDTTEPLIGTSDETLLPADGMLLMYGDGGAGKTTLSVDALAHLASGTDWLGITIPHPVCTALIENEGPRGPFRRRLEHKQRKWQGSAFSQNVHVLEEPWSTFTLAEAAYRRGLAKEIDRTQAALVIVGPLASLGAKGTGTPDDVNEFSELVTDLRARTSRPFALWIIHHENKAGDVSGAWERVPDTLVSVTAQGNGRTRVWWRKVRWSSTLHNTASNLLWAENAGFTIDEARDRDYPAELVEAFTKDNRWRTARETAGLISANQDKVREVLADLVTEGRMTFQIGPDGRSRTAKCWRLRGDSDPPSHPESPALFEVSAGGTDSVTPPTKESRESGQYTTPPPTDSDTPSQSTSNPWLDA